MLCNHEDISADMTMERIDRHNNSQDMVTFKVETTILCNTCGQSKLLTAFTPFPPKERLEIVGTIDG